MFCCQAANILKRTICFYHQYIFPSQRSLSRLSGQETHKQRWKRSAPRWACVPFVASHLVVSAWSAFSRVSFSLLFCSRHRGWGTEHYHYSPLTLHGRADHINNLTVPWSCFSPWKNFSAWNHVSWFITGAEIKTGTEEATFTSLKCQILKIIDGSAETFIFSFLVFNWLPLTVFFPVVT